jgi:hypothetical protein
VPDNYDVAQICLNGHVITEMARDSPQYRQDFCAKCGVRTITACEHCGKDIRGYLHGSGYFGEMDRPAFCQYCGDPYPWTEAALSAARDIADELDNLSPDEREALKGTLDDLVRDSPRTSVAVLRFKKFAAKAGSAGAAGLRDVLVGVVTEAARKAIWGP